MRGDVLQPISRGVNCISWESHSRKWTDETFSGERASPTAERCVSVETRVAVLTMWQLANCGCTGEHKSHGKPQQGWKSSQLNIFTPQYINIYLDLGWYIDELYIWVLRWCIDINMMSLLCADALWRPRLDSRDASVVEQYISPDQRKTLFGENNRKCGTTEGQGHCMCIIFVYFFIFPTLKIKVTIYDEKAAWTISISKLYGLCGLKQWEFQLPGTLALLPVSVTFNKSPNCLNTFSISKS